MKQKRGLGLTYQRGSRWWIQYSVRGVRHREPVPATVIEKDGIKTVREATEADGVRLLKHRIGEVAQGKAVGSAVTKTTLGDLTDMVENDYRANGRHSDIKAVIAHLHAFFGKDERVVNISSDRITAYIAERQQETWRGRPVKPATVNIEVALLRRGFRLAARAGKVNAVPNFDLLAVKNARKGFFERPEFEAVLAKLPVHLKPLIETMYLSGWRRGEVLSRQWKHIDFAKGWMRLDPGETKNGEGRMFPLTAELRAVLETQRAWVSEIEKEIGAIIPHIFINDDGTPIRNYRRSWATACKAAGVPGRLVHDFRRTAVRNLERAGVSRSAAMKLTGHKTESVYRRYAIVSESDLREAGDKLAALYAGETTTAAKPKVVALAGQAR